MPLDTNEPTAPYIIGQELTLRKLSDRQLESNPQPYEQRRPMTIKISASTEKATTAYILMTVVICLGLSSTFYHQM